MYDAGNLYSKYGLNPIQVSVFFNQQCVLKKRDKKRFSNAIVDIVIQNLPLDGHCLVLEYDCDNTNHFPEEIVRIRIWNTSDIERSFYSAPFMAFIPTITPEDIMRTLLSKESKVERYRERCQEIWLLINCEIYHFSTHFKHEDNVVQQAYYSGFDRIFLIYHIAGKVYELNVIR
jgi:hypothetical protein